MAFFARTSAAEAEVEALRRRVQLGTPFGSELWVKRSAPHLDLHSARRPGGRPQLREESLPPAPFVRRFFLAIGPAIVYVHLMWVSS